ncbi:MAG: hypothetical protein FXF54_08215 [Kosmotoga sp.]|nr:MAG: hypothetical protein FXF54_08215 [Kosmotoga sp.]
MKKISILIVFLTLIAFNADAALIKSKGRAVIEKGNVEEANNQALQNALLNGIAQYYQQSDKTNIPEITPEFFKFISYYRILDRRVENFEVKYKVELNLDEVAISDLKYFLNNFLHSAVYNINFQDNTTQSGFNSVSDLNDNISGIFEKYNFTTKHQQEFSLQIPQNPSFKDIITVFGSSRAKFLFSMNISTEYNKLDENYICKLTLLTNIYKKDNSFPEIKSVASSLKNTQKKAFIDAFKKSLNNTLKYVRKNLIKLPETNLPTQEYQVVAKSFPSLGKIQKLMQNLKDKGIIIDFKVISYSQSDMQMEIFSKFSREDLINKLNLYKDEYNFLTNTSVNNIVLNFGEKM